MSPIPEIAITGIGVVTPIGTRAEPFWQALVEGRSGVRRLSRFDVDGHPVQIAGEIPDFDPKQHIRPLKSLKVMSRDIQLGVAAAALALTDSGLDLSTCAPERRGVVMGSDLIQCDPAEVSAAYAACCTTGRFEFDQWGPKAIGELYPLWMLKYLPNMPSCHVAIAHDCRGPNNTIVQGDVSSLLAISEAAELIRRGVADVMLAGGTNSLVHPTLWVRTTVYELSRRNEAPQRASRPFDRARDGQVNGEGSAVFVLERTDHANARHARTYARWLGLASGFQPANAKAGEALSHVLTAARRMAETSGGPVGHVGAHGVSTRASDKVEAQAIARMFGEIPVTAPKGHFGNLGAGSGAVELAASALALSRQAIPPTLNYETRDPDCPVDVVSPSPLPCTAPAALKISLAPTGQVAVAALGSA